MDERVPRRRYLQGLATAGIAMFTGCLGQSDSESTTKPAETATPTATATESQTDTASQTPTETQRPTETKTEQATETETPTEEPEPTETETETQPPEAVRMLDGEMEWDELNTRFEEDIYPQYVPDEGSEAAEMFSGIDLESSKIEDAILEAAKEVYKVQRGQDYSVGRDGVLERFDKFTDGLAYVLDQNGYDGGEVIVDQRWIYSDISYNSLKMATTKYPTPIVDFKRSDGVKEIRFNPYDGSVEELPEWEEWFASLPGDTHEKFPLFSNFHKFGDDELGAGNGYPGQGEDHQDYDEDDEYDRDILQFDQIEKWLEATSWERHPDEPGGEDEDSWWWRQQVWGRQDDCLVVGRHGKRDGSRLIRDKDDGNDVFYSDSAKPYVADTTHQEKINDAPGDVGVQKWHLKTAASMFYEDHVRDQDKDMRIDYFEEEDSLTEQIDSLEEEETPFLTYQAGDGGYVLMKQIDDRNTFPPEEVPSYEEIWGE